MSKFDAVESHYDLHQVPGDGRMRGRDERVIIGEFDRGKRRVATFRSVVAAIPSLSGRAIERTVSEQMGREHSDCEKTHLCFP